jgi:hypothetical protein
VLAGVLVDTFGVVLALLAVTLAAVIRRLIALSDYVRGLEGRISWLEAKANGKPNK